MIRFGSRGSELARAQTRLVGEEIKRRTGQDYSIEIIETRGDRIVDRPLAELGGKGLFTAELEAALRAGRIDAAVHSLKDLPVEDPDDLVLGAIPGRADAHDVLVYDPDIEDPEGGTLPVADGSRIGTSSPRRRAAVAAQRPHLRLADIRGNVTSRLSKVRAGEYGATLLAAAGLHRLGAPTRGLRVAALPTRDFTPAPGQGALAVQCRRDDPTVRQLLAEVHDDGSAARVSAERHLLELLGGGCSMPLGALVTGAAADHCLQATLYSASGPAAAGGAHRFTVELSGADPHVLARRAADELAPLVGDPLAGLRVCLVRPGGAGGRLGAALGVAGADLQTVALTEILPLQPGADAEHAIRRAQVVAFTSARAVDRFFEIAAACSAETAEVSFFAAGPATAAAVRARQLPCAEADPAGGASLARLILETCGSSGGEILFPCAAGRQPDLERVLRDAGREVTAMPVYETRTIRGADPPDGPWHYTVFTSPSAARAFHEAGFAPDGRSVAIGETTARAMRALGIQPSGTADQPTPQALVDEILELQHAHTT